MRQFREFVITKITKEWVVDKSMLHSCNQGPDIVEVKVTYFKPGYLRG